MAQATHMEFVQKAFDTLRGKGKDGVQFKGLHTVYSGFNAAFREYFPDDDPQVVTKALHDQGLIVVRPTRGGGMIYMPDSAPASSGATALGKMGL